MAGAIAFQNGRRSHSALTPELREFIDRCLVPILVRECFRETAKENSLAASLSSARDSGSPANRSTSEEHDR